MATQAANAVIPFQFEAHEIRTLLIDDQPWFVAMDVAATLLYSDAEAMTRKLDDDEMQNRQLVGFGNRGATLINESGLYSAILRSRKAEAKRFKKWVTAEVLPTIRRTGSYHAETLAGETIGTDGLKVLRELIGKKVRVLPTSARSSAQHRLWNLLHTRFNVPKAEMIAANDMDAAANFVGQWAIEGEYLERARPASEATAAVDFPRRQKAAEFTPESLYGPEAWKSDLSMMMAELRRAAESGKLLRVENIDGAMEEMLALRHLGEISHKAPVVREPETRKSQTLYYSLIALEHFLEVLAGKSPAGQEISAEQRQHYQQRAERCVAECIALAQDPGRLAESGEVATILRNVEALSGRANALERDFVERVGPALKLLDSRLYGNWREHIGVLARYLNMNGKRSPVHALTKQ